MIVLSKEQVKSIHKKVIDLTGGSAGIRDETLLESALASPFQTFGGVELFPSTISKIARMTYGLVCNHPFVDGNKRSGVLLMLNLLALNQIKVDFTDDKLVYIGLKLASGEMDVEQLIDIILEHLQ